MTQKLSLPPMHEPCTYSSLKFTRQAAGVCCEQVAVELTGSDPSCHRLRGIKVAPPTTLAVPYR